MNANVNVSEKAAVLALLAPIVVTSAAAANTGAVDMSIFHQAMFVFSTGDMASGTIDFTVEQSADSAFTTPVALKAATQLAAHATNNDDKVVVVAVRDEDLTDGLRYVRGVVTIGDATGGPVAIVAISGEGRYGPEVADDNAAVVEVVQ